MSTALKGATQMTVTIACVAFDCADALTVARFWSAAVDRPLDAGATEEFAKVPEPKTSKNRVHLDLVAPDLEAEIDRLVELGATRVADRDEYGYTWTLMTDPEGNEFDIGKAL
jgi:predicted enzyme related to lactoylglutathione lyase